MVVSHTRCGYDFFLDTLYPGKTRRRKFHYNCFHFIDQITPLYTREKNHLNFADCWNRTPAACAASESFIRYATASHATASHATASHATASCYLLYMISLLQFVVSQFILGFII